MANALGLHPKDCGFKSHHFHTFLINGLFIVTTPSIKKFLYIWNVTVILEVGSRYRDINNCFLRCLVARVFLLIPTIKYLYFLEIIKVGNMKYNEILEKEKYYVPVCLNLAQELSWNEIGVLSNIINCERMNANWSVRSLSRFVGIANSNIQG